MLIQILCGHRHCEELHPDNVEVLEVVDEYTLKNNPPVKLRKEAEWRCNPDFARLAWATLNVDERRLFTLLYPEKAAPIHASILS